MPRAALVILNELSLSGQDQLSDSELESLVSGFVDTLIAARKVRGDLALASQRKLSSVQISQAGLTLAAFLEQRGGRSRELLRFILGMMNHAPFSSAPAMTLPDDDEEFLFREHRADGLGLAAVNRQLAASLRPEEWGDSIVSLERTWVEEDGDEAVIQTEAISTIHAATVAHIAEHEQFIRQLTLPEVVTGKALWADRRRLFPRLEFLPSVEVQITQVAPGSVALMHILERLRELDEAAASWDPTAAHHPEWRSHVTPESEQRKRLCFFRDLDGQTRCFDLHARYRPGPGRIHFRLEPAGEPRLIVAHVGRKL